MRNLLYQGLAFLLVAINLQASEQNTQTEERFNLFPDRLESRHHSSSHHSHHHCPRRGPTGPAGTIAANFISAYSPILQSFTGDTTNTIVSYDEVQYPPVGITLSSNTFTIQNTGTYLITWSFIATGLLDAAPDGAFITVNLLVNGAPISPVNQASAIIIDSSGNVTTATLANSISLHLDSGTTLQLQVTGFSATDPGTDIGTIGSPIFTVSQIGT